MNGIAWLVSTPKITPATGRVIKKLNMKFERINKTESEQLKRWKEKYYARKDASLAQRKQKRVADRAAREHAAVLGNRPGVRGV